MKVRCSFVVDIDPEAWQQAYGVDAAEVKEDVKTYVEVGAVEHLRELGLLKEPVDA